MKSQRDIEARVRALVAEELSLRLEEATRRLPHLCQHNHRQPVDTRKTIEDLPNPGYNRVSRRHLPVLEESLGLCMLGASSPEDWKGTICEDPIDAQTCPVFLPILTKDAVTARCHADLSDPAWVGKHLPELATLLEVLGVLGVYSPGDEGQHWARALRLPWWKRLWFWLFRVEIEPVRLQLTHDLSDLLPPSEEDPTP